MSKNKTNNRGMAIALSTIVILIVILLVLVVVATYFLGGFGSVGATIIGTGNDTQQEAGGISTALDDVLSGLGGGGTGTGGSGITAGDYRCCTDGQWELKRTTPATCSVNNGHTGSYSTSETTCGSCASYCGGSWSASTWYCICP